MRARPTDAPTAAAPSGAVARRGLMLVLSSPSGAGKTTIAKALLERDPNLAMSVSATTRPPRPGEIDGRDYSFLDAARFESMVAAGAFLEHAVVFGNRYGTPRAPVEAALAAGRDVLFDVDWQGTQQLRQATRGDVVGVFILPPSQAELERRLRARAQDADHVVRHRMARAADEISHWDGYDYIIVNHTVPAAVEAAHSILQAERLRRERQVGLAEFVRALTEG